MLSYRQIHLEVNSGLRGTGAILIFKMNLTIGDRDTICDRGDNSNLCDKLASFSPAISLCMYVHQQSCYSQWIYSKNLSLRFLEETEDYSSQEPLATAFSRASQHTALFYMLLLNTQRIHDHSLRPGRRSSNTHLPLCLFPASLHSGTSLNTFSTVLGVIFFKQWNHQQKVWERGQALWKALTQYENWNTEAGRYKAQPQPWMYFGHSHLYKYTSLTKLRLHQTLKKVLFHFTSLSISGKCLCTSHVIVSVGFII